ncbi:MAG: YdbL family protein [Sphingomonadales bacterium]|nr:YdbL family protein [Sphingomonadales bacterium]MBL0000423.1 YdbL family protein [Sphingomonadales bacterium]
MTKKMKIIAGIAAGALLLAGAGISIAQSGGLVSEALADGTVGEQADGYLGIRGSASEALRAEVDAINIKRRAAYTQRAAQKGATVKEVAAAVGCETLATRVASGRAYLLPDGVWRVKSTAPIALPSYCAG